MSLLHLPDEILLNEVLPRWDSRTLCIASQVDKHFQELCNDETVWFHKVKMEFPLYQRKNTLHSWRSAYRYLEHTGKKFLREVFNLGLYFRGFHSGDTVYPLKVVQCKDINFDAAYDSIIKIYELWYSVPPDIKDMIEKFKLMRYYSYEGYRPHISNRDLFQTIIGLGLSEECARLMSGYLITSAVYYLKKDYNIEISNCDMKELGVIC